MRNPYTGIQHTVFDRGYVRALKDVEKRIELNVERGGAFYRDAGAAQRELLVQLKVLRRDA